MHFERLRVEFELESLTLRTKLNCLLSSLNFNRFEFKKKKKIRVWQIMCEILLIIKHWYVKHVVCFWFVSESVHLSWFYLQICINCMVMTVFILLNGSVYMSYMHLLNIFDIKIETKYNKLSLTWCWQEVFLKVYRCKLDILPVKFESIFFLSMLFVDHSFFSYRCCLLIIHLSYDVILKIWRNVNLVLNESAC